ncbi:DMT family transporter [Flammeovirga yaeyamensis]|uniref:DMT family transporter n=1 Tax=Flammeovirga yaeyamensis TaxID=367791 RepID=A0AAX1N8T3_9BACT|nr:MULTISPECIES: DMT family transporter [Flammeovirga]ANQ48875.1 EamA family transporter [Flammeovirga sp. MY04]MBB3698958.1 drug/metabolite transporter (DMT)-like permease [Flammeovirga yaeyamensis]NMF36392.1 EamA family transporter [Flammeovirga yaeyamensis]QWG03647.1 DMT family transporter [Flammeovirga yaeyamensis]
MALESIFKKLGFTGDKTAYAELHFWIMCSSMIPIINIYITLSSVEIVFLRTLAATVIVFGVVLYKKVNLRVKMSHIVMLFFTGLLTAIYWVLFVVAAKKSNTSVTLVGIATTPIWVSFIYPVVSKKSPTFTEVMTGLSALFGVYMIFSSGFAYSEGMFAAILAAFFAAVVTILTSKYSKKYHYLVITFYQMCGAFAATALFLPYFLKYISKSSFHTPTSLDIVLIIILAVIFSIIAYSSIVKVMQKITPFSVSLANNVSPIYGGVIAYFFFGDSELMDIYFYGGAFMIAFAILAMPLARFFFKLDELDDNKSTT